MKKSLKKFIIVLGIFFLIVIVDTLQARILKHSPIINYERKANGSKNKISKGILMDTFYCTKENDIITVSWHLKFSKFSCPTNT